jgi:hypothetical protein
VDGLFCRQAQTLCEILKVINGDGTGWGTYPLSERRIPEEEGISTPELDMLAAKYISSRIPANLHAANIRPVYRTILTIIKPRCPAQAWFAKSTQVVPKPKTS